MKTLSFRDLKVGRSPSKPLLDVDSEKDAIKMSPGLHLIVAPNGYGKTTLLQTIAGVIPPLGGELRLDAVRLEPGKQCLYVSEYLSFPKFIYPSEWIHFIAEGARSEFEERAIAGFQLAPLMKTYLGRMSQGERRKVTWLGADASARPVLLLDEPLDGLDLLAVRTAREMIENWKKQGRIVCVIAHQVGEILDLADEVFLISEGKLLTWSAATGSQLKDVAPTHFREEVLRFYSSD